MNNQAREYNCPFNLSSPTIYLTHCTHWVLPGGDKGKADEVVTSPSYIKLREAPTFFLQIICLPSLTLFLTLTLDLDTSCLLVTFSVIALSSPLSSISSFVFFSSLVSFSFLFSTITDLGSIHAHH